MRIVEFLRGTLRWLDGGRAARRDLAASEARLRLLSENGREVIYRYRLEPPRGIEYVSPSVEAITGYAPEEYYAGLGVELVLPDDRGLLESSGGAALRWYRRDGSILRAEQRNRLIRDAAGTLVALEGSLCDMTERGRLEEDLREAEVFARSTLDSLSAHIAILDETGLILATNRAWRDFASSNPPVDESTGVGSNYLQVCDAATGEYSEEAAPFARGMREVISGRRESFEMEYPCHSPNEKRWFVGRVTRFSDTSPPRVVVAHEDITGRKLAEEELRDSEERYRLLFEDSPHPMWAYDLETLAFLAVNQSAVRHYGYTREEFLSKSIEDIRPPEDVPALRNKTLIPVQGTEEAGTWRHQRKDGEIIDVEVTTRTFVFGGRHAKLVLANDVTERRQSDEALRFQKALLESQSEASIDGILVVSGSGQILSHNKRFVEMWGVPEEAISGRSDTTAIDSVLHKIVDAEGFLERVAYLYEHPEEESHEEVLLKDGRTFDRYSSSVVGEDGEYYGRVWYFRDITDRKQIEQKLARALRSKTDFFADVSHELRTPLTMIRTSAEVGLEIECGHAHAKLLKAIVEGSTRMSRLVDDLLFLARSDSESLPLGLEPVSVPPFLIEISDLAVSLAHEGGASVEPRLSGEGWLLVDPVRIVQAVLILVDNAARYGPPGDIVELTSSTTHGELCVEVEDHGPGIPEADLPHVFDRFYRGGQAQTRDNGHQGGTGLGLAIARAIAEAHGGRVEAASRVGAGTLMSLHLPLAPDPQTAGPNERYRGLVSPG